MDGVERAEVVRGFDWSQGGQCPVKGVQTELEGHIECVERKCDLVIC